MPMSTML